MTSPPSLSVALSISAPIAFRAPNKTTMAGLQRLAVQGYCLRRRALPWRFC